MKFIILVLLVLCIPAAAFSAEKSFISISIEGKNYSAELENNITIREIVKNLPLSLNMSRYAGHEFYSELSFRPEFAPERTSHILPGHLYYWDGWNAFVINYEDSDISPYKVIHIGRIVETEEICNFLRTAEENISVKVSAK